MYYMYNIITLVFSENTFFEGAVLFNLLVMVWPAERERERERERGHEFVHAKLSQC